jgi:hypothetical protein
MKNFCRASIWLLIAALLPACSSGAGIAPLAPQPQSATSSEHRATGRLIVRIRIPKKRQTRRIGPRYISAATKGMTMAFKGPSTFTKAIDLTPSNTDCSGSPLQCTIAIVLAPGKYTVTVDTYDKAPVAGAIPVGAKLLSTARKVPLFIAAGVANTIDLTLDGVPATILVGGLPTGATGTAFSDQSFNVVAKDANGYIIVGTYSTPITLTDSDTSGATTIVTAGSDSPPAGKLLSSSDTAALSYSGNAILPATITAAAGTAKGSAQFLVQLPVFVADSNNVAVKEIPPGCAAKGCVTTLGHSGPTFLGVLGVAVDRSGDVFVANEGTGSPNSGFINEIPAGCTLSSCVTSVLTYGAWNEPTDVAVDGSGNLFVADGILKELPAGCGSTSCLKALGGGFSSVWAVAVDGSDNVYVADVFGNNVDKLAASCTSSSCVTTIGGGFNNPDGVAVDGSGNVFVADGSNNAVKEIPPGCAMATCVTTIGGGFSGPAGVAVDIFGNVYVGDFGHNAVKMIPPGCGGSYCVSTIGGGFSDPAGVAWGL